MPQLSQQAPPDPDEHFRRVGRRPVGTPDRNYRFLNPERCRHTTGGSTLDATCRYANTGPSSGTITLEFDDPSKAGCEVSLAYSSLTSGSFHDECFGAGVRVAVDFDTSFRLPPLPEAQEQDIPRAPRSREEFDVLAWGPGRSDSGSRVRLPARHPGLRRVHSRQRVAGSSAIQPRARSRTPQDPTPTRKRGQLKAF